MQLIQHGRLQLAELARLAHKPPYFEPSPARFWDDPYIAQQMLKAHLDPNTEAASRRPETIDLIVNWIRERAGLQPGARLLDLGCGPGLYTRRFAEQGVIVTGVDLSENSLNYARAHDSASTYIHADYRQLDLTTGFDAVTLIYGDLCVLNDADRDSVLATVHRLLRPGGWFFFDVTTPQHPDHRKPPAHWDISTGAGFWKPTPHLTLTCHHVYPDHTTDLDQYLIIEESGEVTEIRVWTHYYTADDVSAFLSAAGFTVRGVYADLAGTPYDPAGTWLGVAAQK